MSGEPHYLSLRDLAYWQSRRTHRSPPGPRPTLGQLQRSSCWWWLHCQRCQHRAPIALAPPVILWGADAPGDKLRQCARCTACGNRGATLQRPSWGGSTIGFVPFPVEQRG
jgi:hypothetical protein